MRKTIIKYVSIFLCILNVFVAVFGLWYSFKEFDNSSLYHWLDRCDTELAVWGIVIIWTIIMVVSAACLTTTILMPYCYEWIYDFVEGVVYKWFPIKQNGAKEEPKIQVTLIKSNPVPKVVVKDMVIQPTITDLDHVSEVIVGESSDKASKINNIVIGKHSIDNFDEYFPMSADNFYTWTYASEVVCERIMKNIIKDDKTAYFYEKTPKDRENLLIGIQTTYSKWRITRYKNTNTKLYDYCIYDYFKNKHYLLIDPVEVSMDGKEKEWVSYISLYMELERLFDCYENN